MDAIEKVGLMDIKDTLISELSGGQLQRVFLAKAFAQDPEVILLDEPTNHLDLKYQIEILKHLKSWAKTKNRIIIGVFHDLNLVNLFSENVVLLSNGKIVEKGNPKNVFLENNLQEVYNINIKQFMINSLQKWL